MTYNEERLINLLNRENADDIVKRCFTALSLCTGTIETTTDPVPVEMARSIYARRARANGMRNTHIEGYDTLIPSLATTSEGLIRIHSINTTSETFVVFTDSTIALLIGALAIPKGANATDFVTSKSANIPLR